jgi:hypothetical protein
MLPQRVKKKNWECLPVSLGNVSPIPPRRSKDQHEVLVRFCAIRYHPPDAETPWLGGRDRPGCRIEHLCGGGCREFPGTRAAPPGAHGNRTSHRNRLPQMTQITILAASALAHAGIRTEPWSRGNILRLIPQATSVFLPVARRSGARHQNQSYPSLHGQGVHGRH